MLVFLKKNIRGCIISIVMYILVIACSVDSKLASLSVFGWIVFFVLSIPVCLLCGIVCYDLGLKFSENFAPDAVVYSSTWDLIKTKFLWRFIPQTVGCFLGIALPFLLIAGISPKQGSVAAKKGTAEITIELESEDGSKTKQKVSGIVVAPISSNTTPASNFEYALNADNVSVYLRKYTGSNSDVVIPRDIEGFPVTRIDDDCFRGCSIRTVQIPNSIKRIGSYAFAETNLSAVVFETGGDIEFGSSLFANCKFKTLNLPAGINFPSYAFSDIDSLEEVVFSDDIESVNANMFCRCTNLKKVIFGNNIKNISSHAFGGCTALSEVVFQNSLITIGEAAFNYCTSLEELVLPDSVERIDDLAFWGCSKLRKINIPANIKYVGNYILEDCPEIAEIVFPPNELELDCFCELWPNDSDVKVPLATKAKIKEIYNKVWNR